MSVSESVLGGRLVGHSANSPQVRSNKESWLSGRKQQFTKLPNPYRFQGFESLTLRQEYRLSVDPEALILGLRMNVSSNPLAFTVKGFELCYLKRVYRVPRPSPRRSIHFSFSNFSNT